MHARPREEEDGSGACRCGSGGGDVGTHTVNVDSCHGRATDDCCAKWDGSSGDADPDRADVRLDEHHPVQPVPARRQLRTGGSLAVRGGGHPQVLPRLWTLPHPSAPPQTRQRHGHGQVRRDLQGSGPLGRLGRVPGLRWGRGLPHGANATDVLEHNEAGQGGGGHGHAYGQAAEKSPQPLGRLRKCRGHHGALELDVVHRLPEARRGLAGGTGALRRTHPRCVGRLLLQRHLRSEHKLPAGGDDLSADRAEAHRLP
mmetsp:Transcript_56921/g.163475  ORF Transcript_56921/g.163475 Transcript_56921/m.163475 type:complete len:257 (-) Transcript_56921:194-964(-)